MSSCLGLKLTDYEDERHWRWLLSDASPCPSPQWRYSDCGGVADGEEEVGVENRDDWD